MEEWNEASAETAVPSLLLHHEIDAGTELRAFEQPLVKQKSRRSSSYALIHIRATADFVAGPREFR